MFTTIQKQALRALIAERAIIPGPIQLSGGSVSAYYFDCRRLTLSSDGAAAVGEAVVAALEDLPQVTAVGGLTLGADPIVGAAMMCAYQRGRRLEGFYVRKQPKTHGTQNFIENVPPRGTSVAIVDDVITSGKSIIDAIERAEREGCHVAAVVAVVDRLEGGTDKIKLRVPDALYRPLYTLEDFPEIEELKRRFATSSAPQSTAGVDAPA